MPIRSLLNRINRPNKRGTKLQLDRKLSDESVLMRFCNQLLYFEFEEIAEMSGVPYENIRKLYYGFRNKADEHTFDKICELFNVDKYMLLSYAHSWQKGNGAFSRDLPFPMRLISFDGTLTEERVWFQNGWYEENFHLETNTSVMRISDHSLAPYGFNRGDIVIASRIPEHLVFKTHHIYMVQEKDGSIYPRVAEVVNIGNSSDFSRMLCNPIDKNDKILFSPLPDGYTMIGRLVWKSGLL